MQMPSFDHRIVVVVVVIAAFGALVAAEMPSSGADQAARAVDALAPGINPAALTATVRADALVEDMATLAPEPDPASFDRAGVEHWWTSYRQKRHKS
jgi:hypothetical protein